MKHLWPGTETIDLSSDLANVQAEAEVPGITALTTREREIVRAGCCRAIESVPSQRECS